MQIWISPVWIFSSSLPPRSLRQSLIWRRQKPGQSKPEPDSEMADADTHTEDKPWLVHLDRFEMTDADLNLGERSVSQGVHWRIYPLAASTRRGTQ